LISETFSTIYEKNKNIVSNFFGSEKKSFEYLIHQKNYLLYFYFFRI
jgi:hypothetical protein